MSKFIHHHLPDLRAQYAHKFTVTTNTGPESSNPNASQALTEIRYDGRSMLQIRSDPRLPAGFHDRLVSHIMDLLTGRRTILWEEQSLYGDKQPTVDDTRSAAQAYANSEEAAREAADK